MAKKRHLLTIAALGIAMALTGCAGEGGGTSSNNAQSPKKDLTFVIVPKVVHPWFDEVNKGAKAQAEFLSEELGVNVKIDYRAPQSADVSEQNSVLEQAAATRPDGIAIDPNDFTGIDGTVKKIRDSGIPVVLFDSPAPANSDLTSIGNDFAEQAALASNYLAKLLDGKGEVAVMAGVPTAPNHRERYETHLATLKKYPGIKVIEGGIDNDSIEEAQSQAAAVIAANPDLSGYLCSDASCPIGAAKAIEEAGKVGKIKIVGMDNLIEILKFIKSGTMSATSSTKPQMQGAMAVQMMWLASQKVAIPAKIDTGIAFIDKSNVDSWIKQVSGK